eukprot:1159504-Pelagomonas_calceolata.AAC.10
MQGSGSGQGNTPNACLDLGAQCRVQGNGSGINESRQIRADQGEECCWALRRARVHHRSAACMNEWT